MNFSKIIREFLEKVRVIFRKESQELLEKIGVKKNRSNF